MMVGFGLSQSGGGGQRLTRSRAGVSTLAQILLCTSVTVIQPQLKQLSINMASFPPCLAQLSKICVPTGRQTTHTFPARFLTPSIQVRHAGFKPKIISKEKLVGAGGQTAQKYKKKGAETKKKKARTTYKQYDQKDSEQFSLCDAMR